MQIHHCAMDSLLAQIFLFKFLFCFGLGGVVSRQKLWGYAQASLFFFSGGSHFAKCVPHIGKTFHQPLTLWDVSPWNTDIMLIAHISIILETWSLMDINKLSSISTQYKITDCILCWVYLQVYLPADVEDNNTLKRHKNLLLLD